MYKNPTPVSIGIIPAVAPGYLIFIERTDGGIALPGGYVDFQEDVALTMTREAMEEMGLDLDMAKWQLFLSAITSDNKLLLFSYYMEMVAVPENFVPNEEVVCVFSAPWDTSLKFPLHEAAIRRWMKDACFTWPARS